MHFYLDVFPGHTGTSLAVFNNRLKTQLLAPRKSFDILALYKLDYYYFFYFYFFKIIIIWMIFPFPRHDVPSRTVVLATVLTV